VQGQQQRVQVGRFGGPFHWRRQRAAEHKRRRFAGRDGLVFRVQCEHVLAGRVEQLRGHGGFLHRGPEIAHAGVDFERAVFQRVVEPGARVHVPHM